MKYLILALIAVCVVGCGSSQIDARAKGVERPAYDPMAAQKDVANNEGRVQRDPAGAIGWSQLSSSYLTLSRQTDDNALALRAEEAARKSLSLRRKNNSNGALRLAKAILEQHRFAEALIATEDAEKIDPADIPAHELHAEILVELGRYDDAWKEVHKFDLTTSTGLSGVTLAAKLEEIEGHPDRAEALLKHACAEADGSWDMSRESVAWFHQKYGLVLAVEGKNEEAIDQFQIAISVNPSDFKSMGALAKIYAATGQLDGAKSWADKSVAVVPSVEVASLLLDLASKRGDSDGAEKFELMVDRVSHPDLYKFLKDPSEAPAAKPHTHDRLYAVFCADHKKFLPDALVAAKIDMDARKDIYAYDTIAWVLHQMGEDSSAKTYMTKAMARGTLDAKLYYHAGMIDSSLRNSLSARKELSKALAINPNFQFGQQDLAKSELARLGGPIQE